MGDETGVARAFVRSAVYREVRGGAGADPAPAAVAEPRVQGARQSRKAPSRRRSPLHVLALLGLLDVLGGGG